MAEKMTRRHPHVFGNETYADAKHKQRPGTGSRTAEKEEEAAKGLPGRWMA